LHPTEWTGGDYPAMRKYVVAHELGHQLQQRLNEANGCPLASPATCTAIDYAPNFSAAADEESCEADWGGPTQFSYSKVSKEYQSLAAVEGFADYVAAVSFNDPNGTDCRIVPVGEVYWNHAGVDTSPSNGPYSCEGESDGDPGREYTTPPTPVEGRDAFGQFCTSNGQTTNNRGTILDWTRFFWDLTSKHDLDLAEVGDIWAATESNTWCSTDSAGSGFGATVCPQVWQHLPRSRFEAAMDSTGSPQAWRNAWDQESDNGVTR
jgi:hypothetical protein